MRAIRVHQFGGSEELKLQDVPDLKPGDGQVVVRIRAVGVNPVETYIRAGKYGAREFPYTPGSDAAGEVLAVGAGVVKFKPGQRVYLAGSITGTYAEQALCTEAQVHPLADKITFEQGAAMGVPYATAYYGLFLRAIPHAGETIFVHGASGGVGIASVQLARAFGLTVIGSAGTEAGLKLVLAEGAHHALDHHSKDYLDQLQKLTDGKGADIILEMAAHTNLGKDLTVLSRGGRVIVIGSRGPVEINPRDTMMRTADIRGMTLMNATSAELKAIHAALGEGLANGTLRPVIGKRMKLTEAAAAHEAILAPGTQGKLVLLVD